MGHSRECPTGRIHEVEKTLNYKYGELCNRYMKDERLDIKAVDLSCLQPFFNISAHQFTLAGVHGPV